jgi:hypothetical protein
VKSTLLKCRPCRIAGTATALLQNLAGRTDNYPAATRRLYTWQTLNRHRLMEAELKDALRTPQGWAEVIAVGKDLHDELKEYKDAATKRGEEFPRRDFKWMYLNWRMKPGTEPKVDSLKEIASGIAHASEL